MSFGIEFLAAYKLGLEALRIPPCVQYNIISFKAGGHVYGHSCMSSEQTIADRI